MPKQTIRFYYYESESRGWWAKCYVNLSGQGQSVTTDWEPTRDAAKDALIKQVREVLTQNADEVEEVEVEW